MATASRQATILVADDDALNSEVLTIFLEDEGYRVVVVYDGDQALQFLERESVDVALLDVMMPGQTGFSVCRALRARPETRLLPVVLVTGLNGVQDRVLGIEAGRWPSRLPPARSSRRPALWPAGRGSLLLGQFVNARRYARVVGYVSVG